MRVDELIVELRTDLDIWKKLELQEVPIDRIDAMVNHIETIAMRTPDDVTREAFALELYRSQRQDWVNRRDMRRRRSEQMPGHTISAGASALKFILGINGGAVVALLALVGSLAKLDLPAVPVGIVDALAVFTAGVFLAAAAAGSAYIAQAGYGDELGARSRLAGRWGFRLAVTFSTGGLLAFLAGAALATNALATLRIA